MICFVDQFRHPGGAQLCLKDIMEGANARGIGTMLLRPGDGLPGSIASYSSGKKRLRDVFRFGIDTAAATRAIRNVGTRNATELVYVNGPRVLPAGSLSGFPLIFHSHSCLSKSYARVIAAICLRRPRATIFAACEFIAAPLRRAGLGSRVHVVYNGVADQGFAARSFTAACLTIGMLGRIAPEKGNLDFVLAARQVRRLFPLSRFVVCGAPLFSGSLYESEVRRIACEVEFRGWTGNVSGALHDIDILVVPSSAVECTPRVILEAMSAGTPVVAYPSGGIPELIQPGRTGLLTSGSHPEALVRSLSDLLTNRDLMRRLAANARLEWQRRYTVQRFVEEICDSIVQIAQPTSGMYGHQSRRQDASSAAG